ncbi:MAG TPA: DNA-3-methyladenine glycosylase [Bacilli bacterium]
MDGRSFFNRHTLVVAQELLGSYLHRRIDGEEIIVRITETECYRGKDDQASHAYSGVTPRNRIMFGPPGFVYVYLAYGLHCCMNITTEPEGCPGAVLIRAAKPIAGRKLIERLRVGAAERNLLNGPGKLTKGLSVDLSFNGYDLFGVDTHPFSWQPRDKSWKFNVTKRIGITKSVELPWRFIIAE